MMCGGFIGKKSDAKPEKKIFGNEGIETPANDAE